MDEGLVKELVARILADPRFLALMPQVRVAPGFQTPKTLIVIEEEAGLRELPELQQRWSANTALQVCVTGSVSAPGLSLPQISFEQALADNSWSRILIPVCSGKQLTQIALGDRQGKLADLVGQAILQGIPVEIQQVDFGFTDRTPLPYRQLMEKYVAQVATYGVTVVGQKKPAELAVQSVERLPVQEAIVTGSSGMARIEPAAKEEEITFEQKLMTEKEAILLPDHAVLKVARTTVLTPAAIDVLKSRKLQVYREGVRYL